jgi:hypothetical protein
MAKRTAILVIHGMGTQKPYETLDQFARGVMARRPTWGSRIEYRHHEHDPAKQQSSWTQAFVRLRESEAADSAIIDLVEYYWAPIINGRVKALQSLRFLMLTALSPFDYLRTNMLAIDEVSGVPDKPLSAADGPRRECNAPADEAMTGARQIEREGFSNKRPTQVGFIVLREIYRTLLIYFPMLFLFAAAYGFVAQPVSNLLLKDGQGNLLRYFWASPKPGAKDAIELAAMTLRWLLLGMGAKYFLDEWRHPEERTPSQASAMRSCSGWILALMAFLLALPSLLEWHGLRLWRGIHWPVGAASDHLHLPWLRIFLHTRIAFAPMRLRLVHLAFYAVLAGLAYIVNRFLTTAAGDLAVYLGADTLSTNFSARAQILSECTAAMDYLLGTHGDLPDGEGRPGLYDSVVIASHSLGTVIAYDMLNDLMAKDRVVASMKPDLARITGLLTFGCPLNKVYYFFRTRTEMKTKILNRILYDLHNFRLRLGPPPDALLIPDPFARHFCWYNAWSPCDVISGRMFFYRADKNRKVEDGFLPWTAHTSYWENPKLYEFFEELL